MTSCVDGAPASQPPWAHIGSKARGHPERLECIVMTRFKMWEPWCNTQKPADAVSFWITARPLCPCPVCVCSAVCLLLHTQRPESLGWGFAV